MGQAVATIELSRTDVAKSVRFPSKTREMALWTEQEQSQAKKNNRMDAIGWTRLLLQSILRIGSQTPERRDWDVFYVDQSELTQGFHY